MSEFASEKRALGLCDRCGRVYRLKELKEETYAGEPRGNRVCPSCFDQDHPQLLIGLARTGDPMGLEDARPDVSIDDSTSFAGWKPVTGLSMTATQGKVYF